MTQGQHRQVGRRRTRDDRIPFWFGLPFLGAGLLVMWLGAGALGQAPSLFVIGFGGLFALVGAGLVWTSIRQHRLGIPAATAMPAVGRLDAERFTRSPMQVLIDLVLAPIGGVGFLLMAVIVATSIPLIGLVVAILPAFFGLMLLRGSLTTIRRGVRLTIAEVGPGGVWTPELGRALGWDEIADLRVESMTGIGGPNNNTTANYRRLGIVPKDEELARSAPGRGTLRMARGIMRFVNTMQPGTGLSDPMALAPFGINASEVEQPFEAVVRSVERFAPVTRPEAAAVPEAPPLGSVGSLFGSVGLGSPGHSVLTGLPIGGAGVPDTSATAGAADGAATTTQPGPRRAFRRSQRLGATAGMLLSIPSTALWIVLPTVFLVLWIGLGGLAMPWFAYPLLLIPLVFVFDGVAQLLELAGRIRLTRGDPVLLTVDPDGLTMRGMGLLRWEQVAAVRVVDSSMPTGEGSPPGARLEVVPHDLARLASRPWTDRAFDRYRAVLRRLKPFGDRSLRGPAFGLDLDLLEASTDEVLDEIARYTVVEET